MCCFAQADVLNSLFHMLGSPFACSIVSSFPMVVFVTMQYAQPDAVYLQAVCARGVIWHGSALLRQDWNPYPQQVRLWKLSVVIVEAVALASS